MLSHVQLFATPWTVVHQASLFMEFFRQKPWTQFPFPTLGDLPDPGMEPMFLPPPALAGGFFFYHGSTWKVWSPLLKIRLRLKEMLQLVCGMNSGWGLGSRLERDKQGVVGRLERHIGRRCKRRWWFQRWLPTLGILPFWTFYLSLLLNRHSTWELNISAEVVTGAFCLHPMETPGMFQWERDSEYTQAPGFNLVLVPQPLAPLYGTHPSGPFRAPASQMPPLKSVNTEAGTRY